MKKVRTHKFQTCGNKIKHAKLIRVAHRNFIGSWAHHTIILICFYCTLSIHKRFYVTHNAMKILSCCCISFCWRGFRLNQHLSMPYLKIIYKSFAQLPKQKNILVALTYRQGANRHNVIPVWGRRKSYRYIYYQMQVR